MKKIIVLLLFGSFAFSQKNNPALDLANAERAFSAASEKFGVKESFLQFLSDDCVMFNPNPVNGKELYKNSPSGTSYLSWHPTFVEVAASGDFGISSGPWEIRSSKADTPVLYGHYFSIWKKQLDGTWKVAVDNGVRYPKEKKRKEKEHIKNLVTSKNDHFVADGARMELLESEKEFILSLKKNGLYKAYSHFAASNILVYRDGNLPSHSKKEGLDLIKNNIPQKNFSTVATQVALSGDLGFTYGCSVDAKKDSCSYIRVWRKEKEWKIAVDMLEPFKK